MARVETGRGMLPVSPTAPLAGRAVPVGIVPAMVFVGFSKALAAVSMGASIEEISL